MLDARSPGNRKFEWFVLFGAAPISRMRTSARGAALAARRA
jgi:hypothetical protein